MTEFFSKGDLFYEPPGQYPESEFEVDGVKVHFHYVGGQTSPHFNLYGDVSKTGYKSFWIYPEDLDRYGVEGVAAMVVRELKAALKNKRKKPEKRDGENAVLQKED